MAGKQNQYDPTKMFRDWIQKSGKAQSEFMRYFSSMMQNQQQSQQQQQPSGFDPLQTLKEITNKAAEAQTNFMENLGSMQARGMDKMWSLGQLMPNFLSWGTYKTSVGSNGRISIPEAEREALGLKEGDLVQVIVLPIERKTKRR